MSARLDQQRERAEKANQLLRTIASCGRKFYLHKGTVGRLEIRETPRGARVWFIDAYTGRAIYTHYRHGRWHWFTEGGTLRQLVECLADFISHGTPVPRGAFGPWPEWVCRGDLWGYGADMEIVRAKARELGVHGPEPVVAAEAQG